MRNYLLYNPMAGHGDYDKKLIKLKGYLQGDVLEFDITSIEDSNQLFASLSADDRIIISGGDGTVNRFVNSVDVDKIKCDILYFASGSGNDFLHDLGANVDDAPIRVNDYLVNLPTVEVKGKTYRFVNGVGFGIDGYCCEEGDKIKEKSTKPVNYTSIAIKGLLFYFKPRDAKVCVDGKEYTYKKVWIAPTMNGKFYGGGMMPTPEQNRLNNDEVSLMLFHGTGKLKTLMIFPSLFKGEHVKHTDAVAIHKGREITVEFDRPTPLQIDGEPFLDVKSYTARSKVCIKTN